MDTAGALELSPLPPHTQISQSHPENDISNSWRLSPGTAPAPAFESVDGRIQTEMAS